MPKAIKSFTVDEEVYSGLVALFKKHNAEVSISLFLNNCLKEMLEYLNFIEEGLKGSNCKVPMSYIINKVVKEKILYIPNKPFLAEAGSSVPGIDLHLSDWEDRYNAYKEGIPEELYPYLREYDLELSSNKKYLIAPKTGKKYTVIDGELFEMSETDKEKKKKGGKHGK